ncbi:hypothetical protein GCM10027026_24960 [Myroides odoratimimus subsp. xuanwuensis]
MPEAPPGNLHAMVRLRRTSPDQPGWTRRRAGRGFVYLDQSGVRLPDEAVERIKSLVIPPAWSDVWITPHAHGHLQAVGTDDAGRRQYIYHDDWRTRRDAEKFERMQAFGEALSKARELVVTDLGREGMPIERACAAAVRLLDLGYFRIGNDVYADTNGSFGLTTLERRHVRRRDGKLVFMFTGKSGVDHRIEIDDAVVIEAIQVMRRRRHEDPGCSPTRTVAPGGACCPRSSTTTSARPRAWRGRRRTSAPGTRRCSRQPHSPRPRSTARARPRASARSRGR